LGSSPFVINELFPLVLLQVKAVREGCGVHVALLIVSISSPSGEGGEEII
jgi:hypothetical protein